MALFSWLKREKKTTDPLAILKSNIESATGKVVTRETALRVATVFACARVIANGIAQVPLKLFKTDGKSRIPASDHALYDLLRRKPNSWQTSYEYRETLALHVVLTNNHFSFVNRVNGKIKELIPFDPGSVTVKRLDTYDLTYEVRGHNGSVQTFDQSQIWHVKGPSWNSWMGLDALALARDCIGLSMAIEESQAKLYRNGVRSSGVLSVEGTLDETQYAKLQKWVNENFAGSSNAGNVLILDHAAKWTSAAQSAIDSQTLETRRYQVEEVCRAFGVLPIMVGHADKTATYASAEQMFLAHVVHTLSPWYTRLENSIDCWLLSDHDAASGHYAKFIEEGLLRGASKDTADFLTKLTGGGIMTRNEARQKLELNPIDGLDEPLTPVNMQIGFSDGDEDENVDPSSRTTPDKTDNNGDNDATP